MRKMQMRGIGIALAVIVVACLCGGCGDDHNPLALVQKAVMKNVQEANITAAKSSVMCIKEAVVMYGLLYGGKLPNSLRDLIDDSNGKEPILLGGTGTIVDPWGNEYKLEKDGKRYAIISAGPDGIFDTEDDIRSDRLSQ